MDSFGARVKSIRESMGITQSEMGDRTSKHRRTYVRVEHGDDPKLSYALEICRVLGVSLCDVLSGKDLVVESVVRKVG